MLSKIVPRSEKRKKRQHSSANPNPDLERNKVTDTIKLLSRMKKYFVKGGIYVNTPFFKYEGVVAGYGSDPMPDAEIIPTNRVLPSGEKYLLIDDEHPQSIFAEYYASSFFTTGYCWAPLFHKSYLDDYEEYTSRIQDARLLMSLSLVQSDDWAKELLSRESFLAVMNAFENFMADIILTRITNDENAFYDFARKRTEQKRIQNDLASGRNGSAEQKVIEYVLKQSYCSADRIKDYCIELFGKSIEVNKHIVALFEKRHLIAHRGGRKKDGTYVSFANDAIEDAISRITVLVETIKKCLKERGNE